MKKKYSLFWAFLLILSVASGCRVTEEELSPEKSVASGKTYPVHFVAEELETRTAFGEAETSDGSTSYPTFWTENDSKVAVSLNLSGVKDADVIPSEDYRLATFDAEFSQTEVTAPYTFYALSPYSACVGAAPSHDGFHLNILTEQTPLATSCDEGAQVMASSKEVRSVDGFSSVVMQFTHVTAYGKMTLSHVTLPAGAVIQSIELTASTPFAGQFYYRFGDASLEESASSRTITLLPDHITLDGGTSTAIWFACAPTDLGGGSLKVDVNTSAGVLSRTVDVPSGHLAFERGGVSKFTVNMSSATFTEVADRWVLVTDASELAAGDEIIIASSAEVGTAYAISTTQNTNNRGRVSVTINEDTDGKMIIKKPGASVEVLELVPGDRTGCFYLQEATSASGRYLYAVSTNLYNYLKSDLPSSSNITDDRGYANWKISVSNGPAYISTYEKNGSNNYKQIRYHSSLISSSCYFSAYKSSSQASWDSSSSGTSDVYIYRKEAGISLDDPILEREEYGAYLYGGNRVFGACDQLSREYPGDGTVIFAILTPSVYEVAEFNGIPVSPAKGDTFTLNYNLITGSTQSDREFDVSVVKVDGPKVWLTTGAGEGFIVKK